MALQDTVRKLKSFFNKNRENPENRPKKLTPNEVELMSYMERERQDQIKKKLAKFRKQSFNEIIIGHNISSDSTLLKSPYLFKNKRKKERGLLNSSNSFLK